MMYKKSFNILIIDDNPIDRELCKNILDKSYSYEFNYTEASNVKEGLERYNEQTADCVILDYNMPEMTGLDFLEAIYPLRVEYRIPVIMLTGEGNEQVAVQAMKYGVQDYIMKDVVDGIDLVCAVVRAMQQVSLQTKIRSINDEVRQFALSVAFDITDPLSRLKYELSSNEEAMAYIKRIESINTHLIDFASIGSPTKRRSRADLNVLIKGIKEKAQKCSNDAIKIDFKFNKLPCFDGVVEDLEYLLKDIFDFYLFEQPKSASVSMHSSEVFESFYQIELNIQFDNSSSSPQDRDKGLNSRLALWKRIVHTHGGSLEIKSLQHTQVHAQLLLPNTDVLQQSFNDFNRTQINALLTS